MLPYHKNRQVITFSISGCQRDFFFVSLPFSAKMPAMHWFKLSKKNHRVSFTTASLFTFAFLHHFIDIFVWYCTEVAATADTVADAINARNKTSTFQTPFSFYTSFMRGEWKCFIIFCCRFWCWMCILITCTAQCTLVPNHTHGKPVGRKEEIRSVAILTLPSQLYSMAKWRSVTRYKVLMHIKTAIWDTAIRIHINTWVWPNK